MNANKIKRHSKAAHLVAAAAIIVSSQMCNSALAGTTGTAYTVSTSGSTALKNWFVVNTTFTDIQPGNTLTINGTTYPTPGTGEWKQNGGPAYAYQLAPKLYNNGAKVEGQPSDQASALRFEYHESGSVEGILEMANDQIAPVTYITQNDDRNPSGGIGNAVWINNSQVGGKTSGVVTFDPINGANTSSSATDNYHLGNFYSGTSTFTLNGNAQGSFNASGGNLNGGQNAVQLAVSDSVPVQVFQSPTSNTVSATPWTLTPNQPNYGQGNTRLAAGSLGTPASRQVYQSAASLNMSTGTLNPRSSPASNFSSGTWNSAGLGNLRSEYTASTATLFVANPGTGLTQVNRTDAQWLQTTGRLKNGAMFNMTTRDVNSGTRNVAALETGIDPTYASGVNDNGNGNAADGVSGQVQIGSKLRYSNKTAGGNELRPTVQIGRMAVGTLSINDASGDTGSSASFANPLRALNYSDSADGSAPYVAANYYTIAGVTGGSNPTGQQYTIFQNEQFVTVKAPDASYGSAVPNIQGDNATHDVRTLIDNTLNSVAAYSFNTAGGVTGAASPAAGLLAQGYIIPQLMNVKKSQNGLNVAGSPSEIKANDSSSGTYAYDSSLNATPFFSTLVSKLTMGDPNAVKSGPASSVYGSSTAYGSPSGFNQPIGVTPSNYLFGNFNQTGVRDFDSVVIQAQKAQAALETQAGSSAFTADGGMVNNTVVTTGISNLDAMQSQNQGSASSTNGATKGDLIVLGDFNGDGKFDGRDLYAMAIGASLTDANARPTETTTGGVATFTTGHINTTANGFATAIASSVLNKNVALDYLQTNATPTQKLQARAILTVSNNATAIPSGAIAAGADAVSGLNQYTFDSNGSNAFSKSDVNQDGVVDINDALAVDSLNGKSYANLSDSLTATVPAPVTGTPQLANLVLAQQIDTNATIGSSDLAVVSSALTGSGATNWYAYAAGKSGPGTISWNRTSGTVRVYDGASLQVSSGMPHVTSAIDPFTDSAATTLNDTTKSLPVTVTSGATLQYTGASTTGIQLNRVRGLNISGGTVTMDSAANHANRSLLLTSSLSFAGTTGASVGKLDLGNNDLDVQNGSLAAITDQIKQGFNASGAIWQGNGIGSLAAATDASHLTAIGVISNDNGSGSPLYGSGTTLGLFDGNNPAATDVLAKYTYFGDTNLDGKVDASDYSRIDTAFLADQGNATAVTGWYNGDFNYDGLINGSDYTLLDNAFNTQGANLNAALSFSSPLASTTSEIAGIASPSAVPEPTTLGLVGVGGACLLSRRRRRA